MSPLELEMQVQKLSEQLDIQAEAITKLVELVSHLDGVDAGTVKPYATRLKRVHVETTAAPKVEAPSVAELPLDSSPNSLSQ